MEDREAIYGYSASRHIRLYAGDADNNNVIDDAYLTSVILDYSVAGGANGYTDVNGSGMVDDAGITIVILNFGLEGPM